MWNFIGKKKSPTSLHAWKMWLIRVTKYGASSYLFTDGAVTKEVPLWECKQLDGQHQLPVSWEGCKLKNEILLSDLHIPEDDLKVIYSFITRHLWKLMKFYWGLTKIPATSKVKQGLPSITMFQDILKYATIYIFWEILSHEEIIQWIKIIFHNLSSIFFTFSFILSTTEPHLWYMH